VKRADMNRRKFLHDAAVASAAISLYKTTNPVLATPLETIPADKADIDGHTLVSEFKLENTSWKVYEDLRVRDGVLTFLSSRGEAKALSKRAEATFAEADPP